MSQTPNPNTSTPHPRDVIRAAQLLTRVRVPGGDGVRGAEAAWAWPLVGAAVGVIQVSIGVLALTVLPAPVAAGFAIAVGVLLTGALHEDGLADCADGFWGAMNPARRLEILKDSRIGAYGVVALILAFGLRWALFTALLPIAPLALIASAMISRSGMAVLMGWMPFARAGGLAAHVGRPPVWAVVFGGMIAAVGGTFAVGPLAGLTGVGLSGIALWTVATLARAKIGGQTGDVLGAAQVLTEITVLATCAAFLS